MADNFTLSNLSPGDPPEAFGPGSNLSTNVDTGDLRRKYNFGDRVSELSLAQDPFFRFVSKVNKKQLLKNCKELLTFYFKLLVCCKDFHNLLILIKVHHVFRFLQYFHLSSQ